MKLGESRIWYDAYKSKDTRFDGRFFIGVTSTGIYCRPICQAKKPKFEHCTFFTTAAAAEHAGYRPCLRCRPELAPPSNGHLKASDSLAHRAAVLIRDSCGNSESIEAIATRLGCSDRHLRREFAKEFHVSPIQYVQTSRLLLAKSLLTDTDLSILDVSLAAGFGSLRRFNELFKREYRYTPTKFRTKTSSEQKSSENLTLFLGYRPPYHWDHILAFLAQRAIPGVEVIRGNTYTRSVRYVTSEGEPIVGWIRVENCHPKNIVSVTMNPGLLPVLPQVLAKVRHLFDLQCDPDAVVETLVLLNLIRPGLCVPGIRLPGCFDAFELAVRAVLGQQISIKAANTLSERLVKVYGHPCHMNQDGLTHFFPSASDIIALDGPVGNHLGPLGITATRAKAIRYLAEAFSNGHLNISFTGNPDDEIVKLKKIPGIGDWTAQYIAMRGMGWPDAFPKLDHGLIKALAPRKPKDIQLLAESWRPWRSYATISLWYGLSQKSTD